MQSENRGRSLTRAGRADACGCCGRRAAESCWRGHPPPPHRRRGPLRTASGGRRPEGARKPNRKPTRKPPENLPKTSFGPHPHGTAPLSKTNSNQVFERYSGWFSGGFRGGFRAGFRGGFRGGSGGGIREVFVRFSAWFSRGGGRAGLVGHASRLGSGWAPCGEAAGGGSAKHIRGFCSAGFSSTMSLLPSQLRLVMLGQG